MWYRLYLAKMPKKDFEEMLNLSFDDFFEKYWEESDKEDFKKNWEKYLPWIYKFTEELHWFWKYVDYSEWMTPVIFKDKNINSRYEERNFNKLDKGVIKLIIEEYSQKVANYYKWLITWTEKIWIFWIELWQRKLKRKKQMEEIFRHLQQRYYDFAEKNIWKKSKKGKYKIFRWSKPYNIEKWPITSSREYEYNIFELIRIYRDFDETKEVLLYYWY